MKLTGCKSDSRLGLQIIGLHQDYLGMRNLPTDHWNIRDYRISQDKVRLVRNMEEYGIFWYIGLGYIRW